MSDKVVSHNLASSPIVHGNIVDIKIEEEKCRSVFPEEIWLLIADKADFGAYQRLCESSPYFMDLLENAFNRWFPQFAEILYKQLRGYQKDLRLVMSKCRMVSRPWQESVDAVIQNPPDPLHQIWRCWIEYRAITIKRPFDVHLHRFSELNIDYNITEFRQHFAETHAGTNRNPFLCRNVFINYAFRSAIYQVEANNLIEEFLKLLRDYGQHIWHCVIWIVADEQQILTYCIKLYEMLGLMPNLKTLSLAFLLHGGENNLEMFLRRNPFPTLKHLKSLKVCWVPTTVLSAVTRANPQIRELAFFGQGGINLVSDKENLPQLEEFAIDLQNEEQFRMLANLSFVWPLKKLCLQIGEGIPTRDFFDLLRTRWSATLMTLSIEFIYLPEPLDMPPLNLQKLKMFALSTSGFTTLDFLLPTKSSLETLHVLVRNSGLPNQTVVEAERTVKILDFRHNLTESNIWSFFPKLQIVDYMDHGGLWGRAKSHECRRSDWVFKQTYKV